MALDDFMDFDNDDTDTSSESETSSNETDEQTTQLAPKGPHGYETYEDYKDTIDGEIPTDYDLIKYSMPIFPEITRNVEYECGTRYRDSEKKTPIACVLSQQTTVENIPRELLMIDTGETEKQECMNTLSDRFDLDVDASTEVILNIFLKTRHVVKLAMSSSINKSVSTQNRSLIAKAIYNESYSDHLQSQLNDEMSSEQQKAINDIQEW